MLDVEGFILVGGASSRMGEDKARLLIDGRTTVERIADSLRPLTSNLRLVGSPDEHSSLPSIPDIHPRWGPLGGIQAALRACQTEFAIIVACDLPFVSQDLFAHLLKETSKPSVEAIVPMQKDGRPQPLCAVYRRTPCLAATEESVVNNQHTPRAMLDLVRTQYINFSELAHLSGADYFFFNLNRREDLERAQQIAVSVRLTK